MYKNIIIAALGAGLCIQHPWVSMWDIPIRVACWMIFFQCLLFFCFFCEDQLEKIQKRRKRKKLLQEILIRLSDWEDKKHGNERSGD